MKKEYLIIGIVIIALFLIASIGKNQVAQFGAGGLSSLPNAYGSAATYASTTIINLGVPSTTVSTLVLAKNGDRLWAAVCNFNGPGIVYLYESATSTGRSTDVGFAIASSTQFCYTIDNSHPYIGPISAISNSTTIVTTIEK